MDLNFRRPLRKVPEDDGFEPIPAPTAIANREGGSVEPQGSDSSKRQPVTPGRIPMEGDPPQRPAVVINIEAVGSRPDIFSGERMSPAQPAALNLCECDPALQP